VRVLPDALALALGVVTALGGIHLVTVVRETEHEHVPEPRIVLGHEHAHRKPLFES
jgi:hypothetical protein